MITKIDKTAAIACIGDHPTIQFAVEELEKYILQISGNKFSVKKNREKKYARSQEAALWVGLCHDFDFISLPYIKDPHFDDYIFIQVEHMHGVIAGNNPRSVLIGVYRFLAEIGCRWVRPGIEGELIPEIDLTVINVRVDEKPSYRHRGICIEGAVSYENVTDMIDWMPKIGMNAYFIQFRESYIFFERWYSHRNNVVKTHEAFSISDAATYKKQLEKEIKKRDLIYHAVGHGWTCEPLGIAGLGWDPLEYGISSPAAEYLAEVNGKRELWGGVPLNTNLCYSNPKVRDLITDSIVAYLQENRNIDILHFWLADEKNNQCECDQCTKLRPSDYFVQMLNMLDEKLTKAEIPAKIAFNVYLDLLWTPENERLLNTERFILMFAPFTRTYSRVFNSKEVVTDLPPYRRNKLDFPSSIGINLEFLRQWQNIYSGDSFDFDYHLWWNLYNDPGHFMLPEILSEDVKNLRDIGLNGYMSCQVQRAFLPTGLGTYILGKMLWDDTQNFTDLTNDYFTSAFGLDGCLCKSYLEQLSRLFDPACLSGEVPLTDSAKIADYEQISTLIEQFGPTTKKNLDQSVGCRRKSWECLEYHSIIYNLLSAIFIEKAKGNSKQVSEKWNNIKMLVSKNEDKFQDVFDIFEFIQEMEKKIPL